MKISTDVSLPESRSNDASSPVRRLRPFKTYLVLFFLAMAPIVALGVYAHRITASAVGHLVRANNLSAATITRALVETEFQNWVNILTGFADNPDFREVAGLHDEEAVRERLKVLVGSQPLIVRAFVTDRKGSLWSDFPKAPESLGRNFSHRDWYAGLSKSWEPYVSKVYRRNAKPKLLLVAVAAPIRAKDGAAVIGAVVYQVTLDGLTQLLRQVEVGRSGYAFLVDHEGAVAAHPRLDLQAREYREYAKSDLIATVRGSDTRSVEYVDPLDGREMLATAVPVSVDEHRWVVVAQQPIAEAYGVLRVLALQIAAAGALLTLVMGGLFFRLARTHTRVQRLNLRLQDVNASLADENRERRRAESELKELTKSLKRQADRLAAANAELEAFSYSVSHDLRSPLRAMDGFSQALFEDYGDKLDGTAKDYLARVRAASQRMARLIDDILALSRISRRKMERKAVDLSKAAATIGERLRGADPERDVNLDIQPALTAEADEGLVHVVLENLLGNAWKFTKGRPGARIEFGAEAVNGARAYFVRDNGAGFDMAYADKLFQPFQRLHTDEEYEGTGIGLATVARAVRRHGGRIWADSEIGRGTTLHFTLEET